MASSNLVTAGEDTARGGWTRACAGLTVASTAGSGSAGRFREQNREHGAPLIGQNEARPGAVASDQGPHEQVLCGRVSNSRIPPIRIRCKAEKKDSLRARESGGDRF
jgi:hypothetical protein